MGAAEGARAETTSAAALGPRPRVGLPTMILYGAGFISSSVKSRGLSTFLMVFYNQVMGLPAAWVGLGTGLALIFDALVDPAVGYASDHTHTRWGRRHPFMYGAAAPIAILFFLLWNPPTGLEPMALFGYMMACLLSIRLFDTFFELPASALAPELVEDYDKRTTLIAMRALMGVIGGLAMIIFAYQVAMKENPDGSGGLLARDGYFSYGMTGAVVMFTSIMVATIATHRFIPWLRRAPVKTTEKRRTPLREIYETLRHRSFATIMISGMTVSLAGSLTSGLTLYVGLFFWEFTQAQLAGVASLNAAAVVVGVLIAPHASRFMGKRNAAILTYITGALGELVPYFARLAGVMPDNGDPWVFRFVAAGAFVNMASWTMTGTLLTAMVADVVEDSAVKTGRRAEGVLFAADSLFKKISGAGGPAIAGLILAASAFPVGAKKGEVPAETLQGLMFIYLPTLIAIYAVSITALAFYNITRESHAENLRKLESMAQPPAP